MQALRLLPQIAAAAAPLTACLPLETGPGIHRPTLPPELGHVLLDDGRHAREMGISDPNNLMVLPPQGANLTESQISAIQNTVESNPSFR